MEQAAGSYQVDFRLDNTVNVPTDIIEYKRDGRTLFLSNSKGAYINVDSIGEEFVGLFVKGTTLDDAIKHICATHTELTKATILERLSDLLCRIETAGFYQGVEPIPHTGEDFPMLLRLTERCNLRCIHCLLSASPSTPVDKELDTKSWCSVIEQYIQFSNSNQYRTPKITFSGGEALLRDDVYELANYARRLGSRAELFSNGTLIASPDCAHRIARTFDHIQISLDGASREIHDAVRGTGAFELTVQGLRWLAEAEASCTIAIVVMPLNLDDIDRHLCSLLDSLGRRHAVRLSLASKEGRATSDMQFASPLDGETHLQRLMTMLEHTIGYPSYQYKRNYLASSCGYCKELTVGARGDIFPCGSLRHSIGSTTQAPLAETIRMFVNMGRSAEVEHIAVCRECAIRYLCGGSCRLVNIDKNGSVAEGCCTEKYKHALLNKLFNRSLHINPVSDVDQIQTHHRCAI